MMPWFIWKGQNSSAMGLWINKLPKLIRANERYTEVQVPGRAGSLTILEGEDVYDSYVKDCTILTVNQNSRLQEILDWLRGSGELVFSNEIDKAYDAQVLNTVEFERISNDLLRAKVSFLVKPFKHSRYPDKDQITLSANGTIYNPGNVASKPKVSITGSGNATVVIGGKSMTFNNINGSSPSGTIVVDCDAQIITKGNAIWTGTFSGDFWSIPVGQSSVTTAKALVIDPNWRWV